jgi:hypothetical protein
VERCGCRCAGARRAIGQRELSEQRTTSKLGMKTTRRTLYLSIPGPLRLLGSLRLQNRDVVAAYGVQQGTSSACAEFSSGGHLSDTRRKSHLGTLSA